MDRSSSISSLFPEGLINWAGHHSGGVKRLLDSNSGQPNNELLVTSLLIRLESWVESLCKDSRNVPRIIFLVGGPGNGKTEAIERTIQWIDDKFKCNNQLIQGLFKRFHPPEGLPVPRLVTVDLANFASIPNIRLRLNIVQDASVTAGCNGDSAPTLLVEELQRFEEYDVEEVYLCCVNRGILDDALMHAIDTGNDRAHGLLESITRAVSIESKAPQCWPLNEASSIAVWPMDVESLLVKPPELSTSPAQLLLAQAVDPKKWAVNGSCVAGAKCPFCTSQNMLSDPKHQDNLLQILRWYELASGKRWNFRDLFSLISYLFTGYQTVPDDRSSLTSPQHTPCEAALELIKQDEKPRPKHYEMAAIYKLVSLSYQHAIFHEWDVRVAASLNSDIKYLDLENKLEKADFKTIKGLQLFLKGRKSQYIPSTIAPLLFDLTEKLDPALASPETKITISTETILLGDLDVRFSRSVLEGLTFLESFNFLSINEMELLTRLSRVDRLLSESTIRRKKPTSASRIQHTIRGFTCRLVRRSLCARAGMTSDSVILKAFQKVVEELDGNEGHLAEVVKQVKNLLNSDREFRVPLTTTFGQPVPPDQRQATLIVEPCKVKQIKQTPKGRPRSPISYIEVGHNSDLQPIPLTYDLFKAIKGLERGMSPASLPKSVMALLDTTRSRMSGFIVRDEGALDDSKIKIGSDGTLIVHDYRGFVEGRE